VFGQWLWFEVWFKEWLNHHCWHGNIGSGIQRKINQEKLFSRFLCLFLFVFCSFPYLWHWKGKWSHLPLTHSFFLLFFSLQCWNESLFFDCFCSVFLRFFLLVKKSSVGRKSWLIWGGQCKRIRNAISASLLEFILGHMLITFLHSFLFMFMTRSWFIRSWNLWWWLR